MARITAGLTTSHIPAIGAAIDNGKAAEPYWQPAMSGRNNGSRGKSPMS